MPLQDLIFHEPLSSPPQGSIQGREPGFHESLSSISISARGSFTCGSQEEALEDQEPSQPPSAYHLPITSTVFEAIP